jgi:hypothetical protein
MSGYEKLIEAVKKDCNKGQQCFNENGCNHEFTRIVPAEGEMKKYTNTVCKCLSKCTHKYCDKLKWVVDRAKHYEEKLGIPWNEILDSWEEDRNYWYMNYYQDYNQPFIEVDKVRVFETLEDFKQSLGGKGFICPACNEVSTDPYECNSGKEVNGKKCNWKVYGLFKDLGKGIYVYVKELKKGQTIFYPVAWKEDGGNE